MRTYFYILFISILGSVFNSTLVYNITTSEEKELQTSDFQYFFRLKLESVNDMILNLKVPKMTSINFTIYMSAFIEYPIDEEVINPSFSSILSDFSISSDSSYDIYKYPFSLIGNIKYIGIYLEYQCDSDSLEFLSIVVNKSPKKEYDLYNMSYNNIYELNSTELINKEDLLLFKLKSDKEENGMIKIKINKEAYPDKEMEIRIAGFIEEPITIEDFDNNYLEKKILKLDSKSTDKEYSTYGYLYEKIEKVKYLVIDVSIAKNMSYFSIYVGPRNSDDKEKPDEKGTSKDTQESNNISIVLIILFIIIYTIIILFVFYFVLRKCGYSKKDNLSNLITKDFSLQEDN